MPPCEPRVARAVLDLPATRGWASGPGSPIARPGRVDPPRHPVRAGVPAWRTCGVPAGSRHARSDARRRQRKIPQIVVDAVSCACPKTAINIYWLNEPYTRPFLVVDTPELATRAEAGVWDRPLRRHRGSGP
jgi:hypothetical protein